MRVAVVLNERIRIDSFVFFHSFPPDGKRFPNHCVLIRPDMAKNRFIGHATRKIVIVYYPALNLRKFSHHINPHSKLLPAHATGLPKPFAAAAIRNQVKRVGRYKFRRVNGFLIVCDDQKFGAPTVKIKTFQLINVIFSMSQNEPS